MKRNAGVALALLALTAIAAVGFDDNLRSTLLAPAGDMRV
jgi:hypothetical protein